MILAVCGRDTFSVLARGYTFLPGSLAVYWKKGEMMASTALGDDLPVGHPARQALTLYTHLAGIKSGYGFFAPNVPDNYKLVFEIHYPDGRIDYALPHVASAGAGLRIATLIDNIGETRYEALRELMIKMIAYSVWREHSDATMIRAVFGFISLPSVAEYRRGTTESYEFLYAYDFSSPVPPATPDAP